MRLIKEWNMPIAGGTVGASIAVGRLSLGIWWETDPRLLCIYLPFCDLWIEGSETEQPWAWRWSLARLTVWKTEFRFKLDLNDWRIGLDCIELDDFSLHFGPFNVQIETGRGFDDEYPPGVPTLRVLFPRNHYIHPWPPRCRCCPPRDRRQCDDVTGLDGIGAQHRSSFWHRANQQSEATGSARGFASYSDPDEGQEGRKV